jgi:hypothetical protein
MTMKSAGQCRWIEKLSAALGTLEEITAPASEQGMEVLYPEAKAMSPQRNAASAATISEERGSTTVSSLEPMMAMACTADAAGRAEGWVGERERDLEWDLPWARRRETDGAE